MSLIGLLLLTFLQGTPSTGEIYHAGSTRRPYGRIAEPSRAQLVAVLEDRTREAEIRALALELLAYRSEPVPFEAVQAVKHLARGEVQVDYARCLGLAGKDALPTLRSMSRNRRPEVKAEVSYALILLEEDGEELGRRLLRNRKEKPVVRVAALRALADRGSPFAEVEALRRLGMEEGTLLFECLAILRRNPTQDHVPALIELLGISTGRAANEAVALLQRITGYRIANDYKTWKHFFLKHRAEGTPFYREPDPNAQDMTLAYMGVPIYSDRVAFVLDSSGSMRSLLPEQRSETRATKAVKEMVQMLPRLPITARFNVIFFGSEVSYLYDGLVDLEEESLEAARQFVQGNLFDGGTNLFGGLEMGLYDPEVEEVLLLTDGEPSMGEIVDPVRILARVARWNRWRNARISTISFGAPPRARAFLYRLAMENSGSCRILD